MNSGTRVEANATGAIGGAGFGDGGAAAATMTTRVATDALFRSASLNSDTRGRRGAAGIFSAASGNDDDDMTGSGQGFGGEWAARRKVAPSLNFGLR